MTLVENCLEEISELLEADGTAVVGINLGKEFVGGKFAELSMPVLDCLLTRHFLRSISVKDLKGRFELCKSL